MTLVTTSKASIAREGQNREQEGTFDHFLNQKITLLKLNDDSSTNDLWIWFADMSILDTPWMPWGMRLIGVSQTDFAECDFTRSICWGIAS